MLVLFIFALVFQGMHQLDNPAELIKSCQNSDQHFHSDDQAHACEVCDYQITHWANPVALMPGQRPMVAQLQVFLPEVTHHQEFHQFSHRGPPSL